MERSALWPTTIIVADLNGLKAANDRLGHAAGDEMLRRAGEVFNEVVKTPAHAARIGGDEFAVLLPGTDERGGAAIVDNIRKVRRTQQPILHGSPLSFAVGVATGRAGERLEESASARTR